MNFEQVAGLYNYWVVIFLMMTGFYIVLARKNLVKSVIGLNIFQTSVFLLYITMGKVRGGTAPIIPPEIAAAASHDAHSDHGEHTDTAASHGHDAAEAVHANASETLGSSETLGTSEILGHAHDVSQDLIYSNPLPSVLMLTAIVVGIATTALALALVVRIREDYGTIDEERILELDRNQ